MLLRSRLFPIGLCVMFGLVGSIEDSFSQNSYVTESPRDLPIVRTGDRIVQKNGESAEKIFWMGGAVESRFSTTPVIIELTHRDAMQKAITRNFDIAIQEEAYRSAEIAMRGANSYFSPNILIKPTFTRTDTWDRFDVITRPRVQAPEFTEQLQKDYYKQIQAGKVLNGTDVLTQCSVMVDGKQIYNGFAYAQPNCLTIPSTATEYASFADSRPNETFNLVTQVGHLMRYGGYGSFSLRTGYERKGSQYISVSGSDTAFIDQSRAYTTNLSLAFSTPLPFGKNFGTYGNGGSVAVKLAEANIERTNLERSLVKNNTLLATDNAYWDLVISQLRLKITEEQKELTERMRLKSFKQYELGLITEYALSQIDAQVSSLKGQEALERNNFNIASETLSNLINGNVNEILYPISYQNQLESTYVIDSENALQRVMTENLEIRRSLAMVEASQISLAFQTNQQKPDLSLSAGFSLGQSSQFFGYNSYDQSFRNILNWDTRSISIGISLRIPIGNRAAKSGLSQARIGVMQARDQLTQVRTTVVQRLTQMIDVLRNGLRKLDALRINQSVLEETLEVASRRHQLQLISEFELLEVQKDFLNLKRSRLELIGSLRKSYAVFLALQNKLNNPDFLVDY